MAKSNKSEATGLLTERMDINTPEFGEFKQILLSKSRELSEELKVSIQLKALQFKMEDYLKSSNQHIQAGEFLKLFLQTAHIQQNSFAHYIAIKPSNLSKLLTGERPINAELALILGNIFKMNPILWLAIQSKNEIWKASKLSESYSKYSLDDLTNKRRAK